MANEKVFRKWLKDNRPKDAVFTNIETATVIGVPDTYAIRNGVSTWIECKDIPESPTRAKLRATQFIWMKKHVLAGGKAVLAIKRKDKTVDLYDARDFVKIPQEEFKESGKDYILPATCKPYYSYNGSREEFYNELLK